PLFCCFFNSPVLHRALHSFPTRRSSDLDGTAHRVAESALGAFTDESLLPVVFPNLVEEVEARLKPSPEDPRVVDIDFANNASALDRKSTRLNSSHDQISYAVFCLKKKKK